jgi:hypothetical protein
LLVAGIFGLGNGRKLLFNFRLFYSCVFVSTLISLCLPAEKRLSSAPDVSRVVEPVVALESSVLRITGELSLESDPSISGFWTAVSAGGEDVDRVDLVFHFSAAI